MRFAKLVISVAFASFGSLAKFEHLALLPTLKTSVATCLKSYVTS